MSVPNERKSGSAQPYLRHYLKLTFCIQLKATFPSIFPHKLNTQTLIFLLSIQPTSQERKERKSPFPLASILSTNHHPTF